MDPTRGRFGARDFSENYLVLHIGGADPVRGQGARFQYHFRVERLGTRPSQAKAVPRRRSCSGGVKWSLYALRPVEQHLVKFLLLLPLAALLVSPSASSSACRPSELQPALLGLAFSTCAPCPGDWPSSC